MSFVASPGLTSAAGAPKGRSPGHAPGRGGSPLRGGLRGGAVSPPRALLSPPPSKLPPLPRREGAEAVRLNRGVVHEDVLAAFHGDEAVALLRAEPLHRARGH